MREGTETFFTIVLHVRLCLSALNVDRNTKRVQDFALLADIVSKEALLQRQLLHLRKEKNH